MENTGKIGIASEKPRVLIDRRLSVAPMMDWTDKVEFASWFSDLGNVKKACHLYVSSNR